MKEDTADSSVFDPVNEHYRESIERHGSDVQTLGWRDRDVQRRNFAGIARVFAHETQPFTVHEIGCGFGDFEDFLREHYPLATYSGSDLNPDIVKLALQRKPDLVIEQRDILKAPPAQADYVVESGVFNYRMGHTPEDWWAVVQRMLLAMWGSARKGISANFLTSYVDWTREIGYYQDPLAAFDFAQRHLERFVEVHHSYYPWEFTLMVYRAPKPLAFAPPPVDWPPLTRERQDERKY